jgi:hypothetical protein
VNFEIEATMDPKRYAENVKPCSGNNPEKIYILAAVRT